MQKKEEDYENEDEDEIFNHEAVMEARVKLITNNNSDAFKYIKYKKSFVPAYN